jgi:gas vesicle protein
MSIKIALLMLALRKVLRAPNMAIGVRYLGWAPARPHVGGDVMKFFVGLLLGLVLGAVGAIAYSVQTGRDLREAYEEVRSDLTSRDIEALGSRLEARFAQMQSQLEERIGQVRERASTAVGHATEVVQEAAETAGEAAGEAAPEAAKASAEEQSGA